MFQSTSRPTQSASGARRGKAQNNASVNAPTPRRATAHPSAAKHARDCHEICHIETSPELGLYFWLKLHG